MDAPNPYTILQVTFGCSAADVKAAYRRLAAAAHPDAGGDPDAFMLLTKARDLLLDDKARRLYDENGVWEDGDSIAREQTALMNCLASLFVTALGASPDPTTTNLCEVMRVAVQTMQRQRQGNVARQRAERDKMVDIGNRFMHRGGKTNLLAAITRGRISEIENTIAILEKDLEMDAKVLKFLDDYTYLYDRPQPPGGMRPPPPFNPLLFFMRPDAV